MFFYKKIRKRFFDKINAKFENTRIGTDNEAVRNKWIIDRLNKIPQGSKLLDAGAGEQQYKKHCSHLEYTAQDFGEYNPQQLGEGMQMDKWDYGKLDIVSDITNIPREDKSFDAILCTEVFEHLPDGISALREFTRLLNKDGQLIITAPFCSMTHFAPYHYITGYNKFYWEKHLGELGFEITEVFYNGSYFDYIAQELRRLPYIAEKYSTEKVKDFEASALKITLKMLDRFKAKDTNSNEILCFGIHVVAKKIID